MFSRISNSWNLVKASWAVLQADKELVIFPIVSGIASIIVIASFAIPMFLAGLFESMFADGGGAASIVGFIVVFAFYLTQYFVVIFSNTALVGAAMIRLEGGDPTVRDGFRIAWGHLGPILGYAFISATVGMILRWLSRRGTIGRIASSLFGMAWGLATFLVLPVLVVEDVGPVDAIKRSARMLKGTWGEQIAGNFSIGLIFGIFIVLTIIAGGLATMGMVNLTGSVTFSVIVALIFAVILVGLILVSSTLSGIYSAAVYRFAAGEKDNLFFDRNLVEGAFRPK